MYDEALLEGGLAHEQRYEGNKKFNLRGQSEDVIAPWSVGGFEIDIPDWRPQPSAAYAVDVPQEVVESLGKIENMFGASLRLVSTKDGGCAQCVDVGVCVCVCVSVCVCFRFDPAPHKHTPTNPPIRPKQTKPNQNAQSPNFHTQTKGIQTTSTLTPPFPPTPPATLHRRLALLLPGQHPKPDRGGGVDQAAPARGLEDP